MPTGEAGRSPRGVAIVAAHPDDETLGLGGRLSAIPGLALVHLTDGAPRDLADARRAGCRTRGEYARARELELQRALVAAEAKIECRVRLGRVDQEAGLDLLELTEQLVPVLERVERVYTHPYEGGHPDHDAAAFAVQCACAQLERMRRPSPVRLEFPSYFARAEAVAFGVFWPDPQCPETVLPLDATQVARKRAALEQFVTQRAVIAPFPVEVERERPAPRYDFTAPPPPGPALYDRWGWALRSARWRREAERALAALGKEAVAGAPEPRQPRGPIGRTA